MAEKKTSVAESVFIMVMSLHATENGKASRTPGLISKNGSLKKR